MEKIRPFTHPGIILKEEFAEPLNLTQATLAKDLGVGIKTISELYNEKRGISPLTAIKLSVYFGTTPEFWMNLQSNYDIYKTFLREKEEIEKIKALKTA